MNDLKSILPDFRPALSRAYARAREEFGDGIRFCLSDVLCLVPRGMQAEFLALALDYLGPEWVPGQECTTRRLVEHVEQRLQDPDSILVLAEARGLPRGMLK